MTWPSAIWLALLPLGSFLAGWFESWIAAAIAMRRLRRAAGEPWYERARQIFPARRAVAVRGIGVSMVAGGCVAWKLAPGPGRMPMAVLCALCSLLGMLLAAQRLERRLCHADANAGRGLPVDYLLLGLRGLPFIVTLAIIPWQWGWGAVAALALGVVLVMLLSTGGWLTPLRWLGLVRPAPARLESVVARAAARLGVYPRATFELASPHANALALPVPHILLFTTPILERLDDDELAAVAAHELAHLAEPRAVFAARIARSYMPVVILAGIPLWGSFGRLALVPVAVGVVGTFVLKRVERPMEVRSDQMGHEHEGESAGTYARALGKIYEANLIPAVLGMRGQVHPDLYDRLVAAGVDPGYARPARPPRDRLASRFPLVLPTIAMLVLMIDYMETQNPWIGAMKLHTQARRAYEKGDLETAARLFGSAAQRDPTTGMHAWRHAHVLLQLGRLDEAEEAVERALKQSSPEDQFETALRNMRTLIGLRKATERREATLPALDDPEAPGQGTTP